MSNSEYFAKWYEANRQKIADRRRERYLNDPDYKAKVLANSKRSRAPQAVGSGAGRVVGKDGVERNAYSLAEAALLVGVSRETLVAWNKRGMIPSNPFVNFYTIGQVDAIRGAIEMRKEDGKRVHIRKSDAGFGLLIAERWSQLGEIKG